MLCYRIWLLYLILCNCVVQSFAENTLGELDWNKAERIYDRIIAPKVLRQLKKEKHLSPCESGFGLWGTGRIKVMHCGFFYYHEPNIEEARDLLVSAGHLYLQEINANEEIRPFLINYPFTLENIEIRIFRLNPDRTQIAPDKLLFLTLMKGILNYEIEIRDHRDYSTAICTETFEEAVAKLVAKQQKEKAISNNPLVIVND